MRLIDADALVDGRVENDPVVIAAKHADTINAAQPEHGRWIEGTIRGFPALICSQCRRDTGVDYDFDYCPNCGARMDLNDGEV